MCCDAAPGAVARLRCAAREGVLCIRCAGAAGQEVLQRCLLLLLPPSLPVPLQPAQTCGAFALGLKIRVQTPTKRAVG